MTTFDEITTDREKSRAFHRDMACFFIAIAKTHRQDPRLFTTYAKAAARERQRAITRPWMEPIDHARTTHKETE